MRERLITRPRIGLSKNTALERVKRKRPLQPRAEALTVPDLVRLTVLSCPFLWRHPKAVIARFDGQAALLGRRFAGVREIERRLGLTDRLAACLKHERAPERIMHRLGDTRQRSGTGISSCRTPHATSRNTLPGPCFLRAETRRAVLCRLVATIATIRRPSVAADRSAGRDPSEPRSADRPTARCRRSGGPGRRSSFAAPASGRRSIPPR